EFSKSISMQQEIIYIINTDKDAFFTFYEIFPLSAEIIIRYGDDHGKFQR
ncbi:uncharacterized protein METZ01_LOCUS229999, partial [marine metagenome]